MRIKIIIEYNGSRYCGWQRQNDDQNTKSVQQCVEEAICAAIGNAEEINIFCAGRTDAGVHGFGQVAHFEISDPKIIARWHNSIDRLPHAINSHLKHHNHNIVVKDAVMVNDEFHARFSAIMRSYRYIIWNSPVDSVFVRGRAWHLRNQLNIDNMKLASKHIIGKHDFTSFCSTQCQYENKVRTISSIEITSVPEQYGSTIYIDISAKSFLHNQVRIIVGTLVDVGLGKLFHNDIRCIMEARNRNTASRTAPAHGLYFVGVEY